MISKRQKRRNRWRSRLAKPQREEFVIRVTIDTEAINKAAKAMASALTKSLQVIGDGLLEAFRQIDLSVVSMAIAIRSNTPYKEFCRGCKYATHEALLPCAVHPIFPEHNCPDWEAIA